MRRATICAIMLLWRVVGGQASAWATSLNDDIGRDLWEAIESSEWHNHREGDANDNYYTPDGDGDDDFVQEVTRAHRGTRETRGERPEWKERRRDCLDIRSGASRCGGA